MPKGKKVEITAKERKKLEGAKEKITSTLYEINEGFAFSVTDSLSLLDDFDAKEFKGNCKAMGIDGAPLLNAIAFLRSEWKALEKALDVREKEHKKLLASINKQLGL